MEDAPGKDLVTHMAVKAHGPFAFSRFCDREQVQRQVMAAAVWNTTFGTLPILPAWAAELNEDLIARSIFGTAAIEGSPLTESEVSALLAQQPDPARETEKERVVLNLREAYRLAGVGSTRPGEAGPALLSEERIRRLHETLARGLEHDRYLPGTYRLRPVEVGDADHGGKYRPPKVPEDIKLLMSGLVEWANSAALMKETDPIVRAILVHYHLALIHPFSDGNGRLARVVEAELLEKAGFRYVSLMMSNYYYLRIDDYYRAFSAAEHNDFDLTPFLTFCLEGLLDSLRAIHMRVSDQVRRLALRKHYDDLRESRALTARRHALLLILLENPEPFTAADLRNRAKYAALYASVSDKTARRDLDRLEGLGLVTKTAPGVYQLNVRTLG